MYVRLWKHHYEDAESGQPGEEWVAEAPGALLHAFGDTEADAIASLFDELRDHYACLLALGHDRLAPRLRDQLAYLARYFMRRNSH